MQDGIKQAQAALRRGDAAGALVYLWNELEPARLEGDRRSLRAIRELASTIEERGDPGQQAEAQRLLEVIQRAEGEGDATAVLGAEAHPVGYDPGEEAPDEKPDVEEGAERAGGFQWGGLVWLLILLAVVLINVLSGTQD